MDIMKRTTMKYGCHTFLLLAAVGLSSSVIASSTDSSNYVRNNCSAQAEGLSGAERRQTIARCVRKKAQSENVPPILAKVSACNQKAGDMTGDARSSFMDSCLKEN
jgi:hypothetical protein